MGNTVMFNAKEFKETLKTFAKFASFSVKRPIITFTFEPFSMIMVTDNAVVSAQPPSATQHGTGDVEYSFDPTTLMNISLAGKDVVLSWKDEKSELKLVNGHLTTHLRVAVPRPNFEDIQHNLESVEIPLGVLAAGTKYLSLPFSFYDAKKDLMPVRFRNKDGKLLMSADDQYSLAKITTDVDVSKPFDVKVPKYVLDCLYGKGKINDETTIKIGVSSLHTMFSNDIFKIYSAGINQPSSEFDTQIANFKAKTSCTFSPKSLSTAIKPLVGLVPKKSDSILTVSLSDNMTLALKNSDIGDGVVDGVDDIKDIYNENSERTYKINMFPKAFEEHTKLFAVGEGHLSADDRLVYYKGGVESGSSLLGLNYIFPVVIV